MPAPPPGFVEALLGPHPPTDLDFDAYLAPFARSASSCFWTPLRVALHAARLLEKHGARRVLDVGSGAGKFCVLAALATPLRFTGIEQRPHLVRAARQLAADFGVSDRVEIIEGQMETLHFDHFDALYFFNPFGENRFSGEDVFDASVELSDARFERDLAHADRALSMMPAGSLVLTYHGYGGRMPGSYFSVCAEASGTDALRLWRQMF